jgi:predicted deacetylase
MRPFGAARQLLLPLPAPPEKVREPAQPAKMAVGSKDRQQGDRFLHGFCSKEQNSRTPSEFQRKANKTARLLLREQAAFFPSAGIEAEIPQGRGFYRRSRTTALDAGAGV